MMMMIVMMMVMIVVMMVMGNDGDDGGWGWDAEERLERWVIRTFDTASRDYETVGIIYIRYSSIGILILGRSHVK